MTTQFAELANELDKESYRWLSDTHPEIAEAIQLSVSRGATPEDVRRFVLNRVGPDRTGLATRCESASRHLVSQIKDRQLGATK